MGNATSFKSWPPQCGLRPPNSVALYAAAEAEHRRLSAQPGYHLSPQGFRWSAVVATMNSGAPLRLLQFVEYGHTPEVQAYRPISPPAPLNEQEIDRLREAQRAANEARIAATKAAAEAPVDFSKITDPRIAQASLSQFQFWQWCAAYPERVRRY